MEFLLLFLTASSAHAVLNIALIFDFVKFWQNMLTNLIRLEKHVVEKLEKNMVLQNMVFQNMVFKKHGLKKDMVLKKAICEQFGIDSIL